MARKISKLTRLKFASQFLRLHLSIPISLASVFLGFLPVLLSVAHSVPSQPSSQPPAETPRIPSFAQNSSPEFSDVGRPRRRQGGGSRGSCLIADKPPLTALVGTSSTGFTLAQSPSFWFYLPYELNERHSVEFVLKDGTDNLVHRKIIAGQQTASGIINLRLPSSVVLDPNQSYEWYLLVQCDAENPERFVFVNGAIRRIERPELQQHLATLAPEAQADLYASEDLWYDALDSAATQLQNAPENRKVRQNWQMLLQSLGLANLESQPIVACCEAESL